jgi:hypothetical protein
MRESRKYEWDHSRTFFVPAVDWAGRYYCRNVFATNLVAAAWNGFLNAGEECPVH